MEIVHYLWKLLMKVKNPTCSIHSSRLAQQINLGKHITLGYGSHIAAASIGDYTYINKYCLIDKNVSSIGKFCSIAYNCRIGLGGHPTNWLSTHPFAYSKAYGFVEQSKPWSNNNETTKIGNDVWIGANATILAGVTIGDGAIIGAHSLVNKDIEPYSIVVGTPAKHIKYRFTEAEILKLKKLNWWDLPKEKLESLIKNMDDPKKMLSTFK